MALRMPESMDECIYFTNRSVGKGQLIAWVYRKTCPKCKKVKMGKPVEKGKVKIRAAEYACPSCGYREEKTVHEESLQIEAQFTCPACGKKGEAAAPYQRKAFQGVLSFLVVCPSCKATIPITKKLKVKKAKSSVGAEEEM
ncbi:MAG: hypothetical protein Q8R53_00445 [Nanoarchaeota archaeon]|nr:hypothetical protein [Nanoarchaeota archaeon]